MNDLNLETKRTKLLPFKKKDLALFHKINVDPFVRQYLWDDDQISLELAEDILNTNEKHFKDKQYGLWAIQLKSTQEIIGYTGLWFFFEEPQPQLLYAILKPYTGQGYATECAQKIINYAFQKLNFDYLIAATDLPHQASQKVAKRLGMELAEQRMEEGKPTLFYKINKK